MAIRNYVSVDFTVSPRIIWIDTTSSTSISVQDLIDTCMTISAQAANMDDAILLISSGKEFLTADGSVKVGLTVTLNNAKIGFVSLGGPAWILCSIEGGNVVAVEDIAADPRVYTDVVHPTAYITVERVSSSSATLADIEAIQYGSYDGVVSLDVINGQAGTAYPLGNQEYPVSNITDAVSIANSRGFKTIFVRESMTIDSGTNLHDFKLIGRSMCNTEIIIEPAVQCSTVTIENCDISGTLDGEVTISGCHVGDLTYVNGHIEDSGLYGTIILGGNEAAIFSRCFTPDQNNPAIIDMGGSGQNLAMPNYSGIVTIRNLDSTSTDIGIGLNSGMVIMENTVVAGGVVGISGIGVLLDYSTAAVSSDSLLNNQGIADAIWDEQVNGHSDAGSTGEQLTGIDSKTKLIPGLL